MTLDQSLEGKRVKITCTDGEVFEGTVTDYIYPEGIAAIDIENCPQRPGQEIGFNETEIASVDVLEDAPSSEAS